MVRVRVIEAFWEQDRLRVWGLDTELPATTSSRKRTRPHPYALDHAALAEALGSVPPAEGKGTPGLMLGTGGFAAAPAGSPQPGEAVVHLPGIPRHPFPPPALGPLPQAPRHRPDQVGVRPWSVPTLDLSGPAVLALLRATHTHTGSASLPFLAQVLTTAQTLVGTRRIIPQLVEEARTDGPFPRTAPYARWRPLLDSAAFSWLREHVRSLPPAARAHHEPELQAPEAGADAMAEALACLCALTDLVAREHLADHTVDVPGQPSVWHVWLDALTHGQGSLPGQALYQRGAEGLLTDLRQWFAAAHQYAGSVRLAFRLVEPAPPPPEEDCDCDQEHLEGHCTEEQEDTEPTEDTEPALYVPDEANWRLQTWVQSVEEPSLMVPLDRLHEGEGADWLPRDPVAAVTRDLGRAARICPPLTRLLGGEYSAELELDLDEACDFLAHHVFALREEGFGALVPPWVGQVGVGTKLTLSERDPEYDQTSTGGSIGPTLVDFDYRAAIGDAVLSADELAELARLKQPLVRLRGEWARLDPEQLRRAAAYLADRAGGTVEAAEAVRMAAVPEPGAPELVEVEADGALGALLHGRADEAFTPMAEPPGLEAQLRPYQQRGAAWLRYLNRLGLGAVLADDMGLGKTVQLLALMADERTDDADPAPTLVVCPTSLVGTWRKEAARFAPKLKVHLHHGTGRPKGEDLTRTVAEADLVVTTYGVVRRDAEELAELAWARVVCDEAQQIKNSRTRQWESVRSIPASSRVALTGTPVENRVSELWSILEFANPGLLGPREKFERGIASEIESDPTGEGSRAAADLQRLTAPFVLRRLKTDTSIITDLPDKQEMRTWCTLTPEQASLYKATVDEMSALIDDATGIRRKGLVLATMAKLKQVCNHPAHLLGDGSRLSGRSGKLTQLEQLLSEMTADGDKALCFTQYTEFGSRLVPYLEGKLDVPVLWLHGGTPRAKREEMVERFQSSDEPMLFLLSLKAAGTGLNLTAANQVLHFDRWWNPAVEDQATDRAHRIGQHRMVEVHKLVTSGTVEERVATLLEHKRALADAVVGAGEQWITELGEEELRELVTLSEPGEALSDDGLDDDWGISDD